MYKTAAETTKLCYSFCAELFFFFKFYKNIKSMSCHLIILVSQRQHERQTVQNKKMNKKRKLKAATTN